MSGDGEHCSPCLAEKPTLVCCACGDETTYELSMPAGGNTVRRIDKVCKAILATLQNSKSLCRGYNSKTQACADSVRDANFVTKEKNGLRVVSRIGADLCRELFVDADNVFFTVTHAHVP